MLFNKVNMESLDRIYINDKQAEMVRATLDKHIGKLAKRGDSVLDEVRKVELPFIERGLFFYKRVSSKLFANTEVIHHYQFLEDDVIALSEVEEDGMIAYTLHIKQIGDNLEIVNSQFFAKRYRNDLTVARQVVEKAYIAILSMIADFIRYSQLMIYLKSENKITIKRAVINKPKDNKKQSQRDARKVGRRKVSVSQDQRSYDYSESVREGDKRSYQRHTESWETRGHWRTIKKSGKRVWISSYKKGEGARKGKDFTV